jgi:hypothetical protein
MSWSGLIAATELAPGARYRGPPRRAPQERPVKTEAQEPPPAPVETFDPDYYAGRFKTDLSQLQAFEGAREAPSPANAESDQQLFDFFGNLSVLLLAVRAGDLSRAQAAADALEMEVLVERSAGRRPGPAAAMLDDLGALFSAVQSRDENAARAAAHGLAADFQSAANPAPEPQTAQPEDGGAAYDTLTQYLDGGAG